MLLLLLLLLDVTACDAVSAFSKVSGIVGAFDVEIITLLIFRWDRMEDDAGSMNDEELPRRGSKSRKNNIIYFWGDCLPACVFKELLSCVHLRFGVIVLCLMS